MLAVLKAKFSQGHRHRRCDERHDARSQLEAIKKEELKKKTTAVWAESSHIAEPWADDDRVVDESFETRPGAMAVPGSPPLYPMNSSTFDEDEEEESSPEAPNTHAVHAQAYLVDEANERERYRQELLRTSTLAQQVKDDEDEGTYRNRVIVGFSLVATIAIALVVVFVVVDPLTMTAGKATANTTKDLEDEAVDDEELIASLSLRSDPTTTFLNHAEVQLRKSGLFSDQNVSSGSFSMIRCSPKPCVDDQDLCEGSIDRKFEPGCEKENSAMPTCSVVCPRPPISCEFEIPDNLDCTTSDCYVCPPIDGQDIYQLDHIVVDVDCVQMGSSVRAEKEEPYQWAIACGVFLKGFVPWLSIEPGAFGCAAIRHGAGYSDVDGGILTLFLPCPVMSLLQCGCAPEGTSLNLPLFPSGGPCLPGDNCPFTCSDQAGNSRSLCRSFPGDIQWFEGSNPYYYDLFETNILGENHIFEVFYADGW